MLRTLLLVNISIAIFMTIAYGYQIFYIVVGLFRKLKETVANNKEVKVPYHRFAAICSARNEEGVIGQLISSLKNQDYPSDMLDIYIIADNCSDDTAKVALSLGAKVVERYDEKRKGKGYALDYFFKKLKKEYASIPYDGYFVFDADNIVDQNFVKEMNKTYSLKGYEAMTSYRNSKNYGQNWISQGYSVWFLTEARFINYPREFLGTSCAISGTGFFVAQSLIAKNGGWPYHLLTEDIEFSVNCAINGTKIGYCDKAVVYDEQPTQILQAWYQRLRWSKGFYQINLRYTTRLLKGISDKKQSFIKRFSCYDLLMTTAPSMLLTIFSIIFNLIMFALCMNDKTLMARRVTSIASEYIVFAFINTYLMMLLRGGLTILTEWHNIKATTKQKIVSAFTFPFYMLANIPVAIVALFGKVEWKPIQHFAAEKTDMF